MASRCTWDLLGAHIRGSVSAGRILRLPRATLKPLSVSVLEQSDVQKDAALSGISASGVRSSLVNKMVSSARRMPTSDTGTVSRDDEATLVASARDGDQEAAMRLCERYRDSLVSFCFRYLNNDSDAEDAAQDVLAKVALADDWPTGSFRAWLLPIGQESLAGLQPPTS